MVRILTVIFVLCAVMLPKVSGLAMELMPSIHTVVICAGDRLIVLRFDEDMNPIEVAETEDTDCLTMENVPLAAQIAPAWRLLDPSFQSSFEIVTNARAGLDRLRGHPPERGPPVLI